MISFDHQDIPIWIIYTTISSILCIFGVLLVPTIDFIKKFRAKAKIRNNDALSRLEKDNLIHSYDNNSSYEQSTRSAKLLNYGLSLSAGSMIVTSIYKVLPRSNLHNKNVLISCGWVSGLILSLCLNYIVHHYTNESLIHCAHSEGDQKAEHSHSHSDTSEEDQHEVSSKHSHSHLSLGNMKLSKLDEACQSLNKQSSSPLLNKSRSHSNLPESIKCLENTIGYDLKNIDHYRSMVFNKNSSKLHEDTPLTSEGSNNYGSTSTQEGNQTHHLHSHSIHPHFDDFSSDSDEVPQHSHKFETPFSKLFSIGLQTCLALSLHKLPEGLIIYFSNLDKESRAMDGTDTTKGSSIFIALAIHNFIEGFAMCLPIYTAFASKAKAVVLISLLGGVTQPLGAFIGYLIYNAYMKKQKDSTTGIIHWISQNSSTVNILLMSVTSGFLFVISLQMLQTAIGFSDSHDHDHSDVNGDQMDVNDGTDELGHDFSDSHHTFGTNCVKWACFGGFLVLVSGVFS
ncbi:uncharacterized protein HGUI_02678 [Hanseniaspora guilliermondii]|uniref:Zinc-regulated transporter 3 n=1 Tax=Hanseniaspora guilliermondii TaxID=56406 RepID=A0A1L0FLN6_9ASCO|nr:uncharacterized protein HGUI_02678 [Hanseniaspora guilliermondii]